MHYSQIMHYMVDCHIMQISAEYMENYAHT